MIKYDMSQGINLNTHLYSMESGSKSLQGNNNREDTSQGRQNLGGKTRLGCKG